MNSSNPPREKVLFVSSMSLEFPLQGSEAKKWESMSDYFKTHVICFSSEGFTKIKDRGCMFHTLPSTIPIWGRLLSYYSLVPIVTSILALKHEVKIWIAQGPFEAMAVSIPKITLNSFTDCRLIIEAHGDWIKAFLDTRNFPFDKTVFKKGLEFLATVIMKLADAYRSVSESTRTQIEAYGNTSTPHHTFPAFMNLEPFFQAHNEPRPNVSIYTSPYILYAGALTELKGVDRLIRSFETISKSTDHDLIICGDGSDKHRFKRIAEEHKLGDRVHFKGYVSQQTLASLMAHAELFVLPSRSEGYGRVLIESMASGTPVVATKTGGAKEIIGQSEGGRIVEDPDPESLSQTIIKLLDNPDKLQNLSQKGYEYVRANYRTDDFFQNYKRLINDVINR